MTDTSPTPAARQIWQDNDSRAQGRRLRITAVDETHATCEVVAGRWASMPTVGRSTRIRLDRFRPTSTGYLYITTEDQ
ncbi:hypothetical protein K1Y80_02330 [Streptomyces sp. MAG02]|nr:hypothetical protein [Streptomyces sp. MAG02]